MTVMLIMTAQAIVIRHDRTDAGYVVDEALYPQVFTLHYHDDKRTCIGTLIDPQWAITAAHCTDQTPIQETLVSAQSYEFQINGAAYNISELALHPDYQPEDAGSAVDLALIRLDRPVPDVQPLSLYREKNEEDKTVLFLGWGYTGIGTIGRSYNDGKFRRAYNTVVRADKWLRFRFDDPRDTGHESLLLEGVPALGDSGGPALLEREDGLLLVGVALGELMDPALGEVNQGQYGAIELYERISSHVAWIDGITGARHN